MRKTVEWTHWLGPVRLGVLRAPGKATVIRVEEITSGRGVDLRGCQRERLSAALCNATVMEPGEFFALTARLCKTKCMCSAPRCAARGRFRFNII